MAYLPLKVPARPQTQSFLGTMSKSGVNLRDLPQFLKPDYALSIKNFYVTADGGMKKREGITRLTSNGTTEVLFQQNFNDNIIIYAASDKVYAYDIAANTNTTIKTYSTTSTTYSGDRYGGYFFITNGKEKIGRISRTITYGTQTANFTVGNILTGATSGATATILEDSDAGATGTLTLGNIIGTFQNGEIITDSGTGSATTTSTVSWTYTTITGAPICKVVKAIGPRLYAGDLSTDSTAVWYSQADSGTNPPFNTWTVGTNAADPGTLYFRNAGTVQKITQFGQNIISVFAEFGKWAFYTDTIDSNGTLKKVDQIVMQKIDAGGDACLYTDDGLFYVNESGLWQLVSLGQPNVPFSQQEMNDSQLLGSEYFSEIDFSKAAMAYDSEKRLLMISCAKDSSINNFIIVYSLNFKAISFFDGWNINTFSQVGNTIYGGSAISTKLYTILDGLSDDGADIWCEYYQEVRMGGLYSRNELQKAYMQGIMSQSSDIEISFDIYDKTGNFISRKSVWNWTAVGGSSYSDGFGTATWGSSAWGGSSGLSGLTEEFNGFAPRIQNFQRLRIRFSEHSKLPLIINWFTLLGRTKTDIRRRQITQS